MIPPSGSVPFWSESRGDTTNLSIILLKGGFFTAHLASFNYIMRATRIFSPIESLMHNMGLFNINVALVAFRTHH